MLPHVRRIANHLFLSFVGILFGVSAQLHWFSSDGRWDPEVESLASYARQGAWIESQMALRLLITPLVTIAFLYVVRLAVRWAVKSFTPVSTAPGSRFRRGEGLPFTAFLLIAFGFLGFRVTPLMCFIAFIAAETVLFAVSVRQRHNDRHPGDIFNSGPWPLLFFVSGFSALIYQIVWQRLLFLAYGVNIESVTIIVSIFMFGLGIGALIGGFLSKRFPMRLPLLFVLCEAGVGLFGILSRELIRLVTAATIHQPLWVVSGATYALLVLPTIMMGATLPLLVEYLFQRHQHVGRSVGLLYSINTLGAACACFATVHVFFLLLGQTATLLVAAVSNLGVALIAYNVAGQKRNTGPRSLPIKEEAPASSSSQLENEKSRRVKFFGFLIISAMVGYISLSQEILWIRLASFHTASKATVFGNVLGSFLVGLAIGAGFGKRLSIRFSERIPEIIALLLIVGSLFYYVATPVIGWIATARQGTGLPALLISAALVASVLGAIFPLLSHHSIRNKAAVGASLGWLYFANIVGATLGSLVTGFVLLNELTVQENVMLLALSGLCVGTLLLVATARRRLARPPWGRILGGVGLATALIISYVPLYHNLLERLYYRTGYQYAESFLATVQNRSGIINVERADRGGHVVLGGGIYDGRFNTDLLNNQNGIDRAYIFATLHPKLFDVLEIGLGTGSWATVVSSDPRVKKLDIVEINPGYLGLIREFGPSPSLLDDPRVSIHTDDGRRWLSRNPDRKYDAILMNTSYHWRAFASHVLSREFLELCRRHLNTGGVVFYNTTHSKDVEFTAAHVFQYVTRYANFVAASDSPFLVSVEDRIQMLFSMHPSRMDLPSKRRADLDRVIEHLAKAELGDRRDTLLSLSDHRKLITDDNLATEFKQSRGARIRPGSWLSLFQK